jgi:hypothetical protein
MKKNNLPKGWSQRKAQRVLGHYERQSEDQAVTEDEAAYHNRKQTIMVIPIKLVPAVRRLLRDAPAKTRRKAS